MGFLNNTTITIDAILTKRGRELLARGRNEFTITRFALADDEVDYRLWDTSHPNGTNYFGSVIENMPLLEPVPDETQALRYKLVTLPKATSRMPILNMGISSIIFTFGARNKIVTVNPGTLNSEADTQDGYTFIIHDTSVAVLQSGAPAPNQMAAIIPLTLTDEEMTQSQTMSGMSVRVKAVTFHDIEKKATQLTVVGNATGATSTISVTVHKTVAS